MNDGVIVKQRPMQTSQRRDKPDAQSKNSAPIKSVASGKTDATSGAFYESDLLSKEYYLNKNRYQRIKTTSETDVIGGQYIIDFKNELRNLSKETAKAYSVKDRKGKPIQSYYAMILDRRLPARIKAMNRLMGQKIDGFCNLLAFELMPVSILKGRAFVLLIERPSGIPISQYMRKYGSMREDRIEKSLVTQIYSILLNFSRFEVVHGSLNADTVYIEDDGKVCLGECFSQPSGYTQNILFETISRSLAEPLGKGEGGESVDFYALGALVGYLIAGSKNPFDGISHNVALMLKCTKGSYAMLTEGHQISPRLEDLLRGLLSGKEKEQWGREQLYQWIQSRRFNLLPPSGFVETSRAIVFSGRKLYNRRAVACAMAMDWQEARTFVASDELVKWVERSIGDGELADEMELAKIRADSDVYDSDSFDRYDALVGMYILMLDPAGPLRFKGFSTHAAALGDVLMRILNENDEDCASLMEEVFEHKFIEMWTDLLNDENESLPTTAIFSLEKAQKLMKKKETGFGLLRCVHELSPTLPCQSPELIDNMIFTKEEFLVYMEYDSTRQTTHLDEQMFAFLMNRLELSRKIRIAKVSRFPEFVNQPDIQSLALLSHAQRSANVPKLYALSERFKVNLSRIADSFKSATIRGRVKKELEQEAQYGSLMRLLSCIVKPEALMADSLGYKRAVNTYRRTALQMLKLANVRALNNMAYRRGLQFATMISFVVMVCEFVFLLLKVL